MAYKKREKSVIPSDVFPFKVTGANVDKETNNVEIMSPEGRFDIATMNAYGRSWLSLVPINDPEPEVDDTPEQTIDETQEPIAEEE